MISRHAWIRAAAFCAALVAASAALPTQAVRADAVDDAIAAMKGFEKAGEEGKCIAEMQKLSDAADSKGIKAIREMIGSKNDKIACAAVKRVANLKVKDLEYLKWLIGKIDEKELYKRKDGRPELYMAVLDSITAYKTEKTAQTLLKTALPKIEDVMKKHMGSEPDYATRQVRVYALVRDKAVMEQLLAWGEQIEAHGHAGAGGGKAASGASRDNELKVKKVILEVLPEITGKDGGNDIPSWRKWWTENAKGFTFPDPGDPAAEGGPEAAAKAVDPAAPEFKDESYGYSVKKPDGELWIWQKADYTSDETPRVMLKYMPKSGEVARAYFLVHSMKKAPKDIKGLVKWCLEDPAGPFKSQLEAPDKEHVPKEEPGKQAGWTVVSGKGNGIAQRVGFGSQERRFYFVEMGTNILYIDAVIRLGAEDDVKNAFWKCLDTVVLPPPKK